MDPIEAITVPISEARIALGLRAPSPDAKH